MFTKPPLEFCLTCFEKMYRYIWQLKGKEATEDRIEHIREYITKVWLGETFNYNIVGNEKGVMLYGWEHCFEVLYVSDIWVEPKYRKQGVATALIKYAIQKQREIDANAVTMLYVLKNNQPALNLYNKLGFIKQADKEDTASLEMIYPKEKELP